MIRNISDAIEISPLIILRFPLLAPRKFCDEQIFNLRFSNLSEMTQIADKLRWYRYQHAMLQSEVADRIGIDRSTYTHYEEYGRDYYLIGHMQKLAEMYGIPIESLMDDYNLFLYHDQGRQIQEKRLSQNMTQKAYAAKLGISIGNLKSWEQNRVRIFKYTREKYFRQV